MIRKVFSFQNDKKDFSGQENIFVLSFSEKGFLLINVSDSEIVKIDDFVFEPSGADINRFNNEFLAFLSDYASKWSVNKRIAFFNAISYIAVPAVLKSEEQKQLLSSFVLDSEQYHMLETENLGGELNPVFLMYRHNQWQEDFMSQLQWDIEKRTDIAHFTYNVLNNSLVGDGIFVKVVDSYFDVIVVSGSKLKLINRFSFASSKDFCYYLIGALKSTALDSFSQTVYLAGDILPGSEIVQLISKYVAQIKYLAPSGIHVPANIPLHRYYNQLSGL